MTARTIRGDVAVSSGPGWLEFSDLFGVSAPWRVEGPAAAVAKQLAAGSTWARARRGSLTLKETQALDREISARLYESPESKRRRADIFESAVADGCLSLRRDETLRRLSQHLVMSARRALGESDGPLRSRVEGAICPHGPLEVTGYLAARAYARLASTRWPDVFVILGTSHYDGVASLLDLDVETSLGRVTIDRQLAETLLHDARLPLSRNSPYFLLEHSWQRDLPLLQTVADTLGRTLRVVPIILGWTPLRGGPRIGRALSRALFEQNKLGCVIASGDLSHFGAGYPWQPAFLRSAGDRSRAQVRDAIREFERPILQAVEDGDSERFQKLALGSSFCARAQVAALMEHVLGPGEVLGHDSVLNYAEGSQRFSTNWRSESDTLFHAASIAFSHERIEQRTKAAKHPRRFLCLNIAALKHRQDLILRHLCDGESCVVPQHASALLRAMWRGFGKTTELVRGTRGAVSHAEVQPFVEHLERLGFLHPADAPRAAVSEFALGQARKTLDFARDQVPYYRDLTTTEVTEIPFLRSSTVLRNWTAFSRRDSRLSRSYVSRHRASVAKKFHVRKSSGSDGHRESLVTVVERAVFAARRQAEWVMTPFDWSHARAVRINRPENLALRGNLPAALTWRKKGPDLSFSPGANPSDAKPEVWDEAIERALRHRPEVIEGAPEYVAAFARRCLLHRVRFDTLRNVWLGHTYPWAIHLRAIQSAFGVAITTTYGCSELGAVGVTCPDGHMHLCEQHMMLEIVRQGQQVSVGEMGALVATTLDTTLRPLIRYAVGDVVRLTSIECSCGRPYRTIRYEGRLRHLFPDSRGRPITYRHIDAAIGEPAAVKFFKLWVRSNGAVLDLVADGERSPEEATAIGDRLEARIGRPVQIRWKRSLDVRLGHRGKLPTIVTADASVRWQREFLGLRIAR